MAKKKATAKKEVKSKGAKKKTTRKKRGPSLEEEWEALKIEVGTDRLAAYTMSGSFTVNAVIEHPKFGVGIVTEIMPTKIQVTFKEGPKFLVHNRS